jgi:branched-subunit amino acid aminotransferase/4-amino-4-deoxychorismate lyase
MGMKKAEAIWLDGALVPWDQASEHLLAHTMHYGVGAFEGVRAYQRADGRTHVFRLREHVERLLDSCSICTMECPYTREQLIAACLEVVRANKMPACYLRPLVYLGYGALGLGSLEPPVRTMVACYEWGAYLGDDGLKRGIRVMVSGITRDTTITLLREQGVEVREEAIARDELYTADEVFLTGTAAEITPVREIDHRRIGRGEGGPVTRRLQEAFFSVVKGNDSKHDSWLTFV